ncbi:MAG: hypothetical protein ABR885_14810 [Mycobacterium sp.]|jgi:Mce-associated membrane protein
MTVEHGPSLDSSETASDGIQTHADEGQPSAGQGSARFIRLAAIRRLARRSLARWRSIVATMLVVIAVGVTAAVYFTVYRADQRVGDVEAHRAIEAASDGAVAVLSYSYDHLDRDFTNAKSHLTGDFLTYYSKFTDDIVGPTAKQGQLTTTTKVVRAAVSDLHSDSAVVLVFVDQTTVSMQKKDPVKNETAVLVALTKVNGSWLISKFDSAA